MKRITATAPTVYQLNSLNSFNLEGKGLTRFIDFEDEEQAKEYLRQRAIMYNDADSSGSPARLRSMMADIQHGQLTLDAVTASIEDAPYYVVAFDSGSKGTAYIHADGICHDSGYARRFDAEDEASAYMLENDIIGWVQKEDSPC